MRNINFFIKGACLVQDAFKNNLILIIVIFPKQIKLN